MNIKIQIIVAIAVLVASGIIINMIRKKRIGTKIYSSWIYSTYKYVVLSWVLFFPLHYILVDNCSFNNVFASDRVGIISKKA